jgi:hypothetical protein
MFVSILTATAGCPLAGLGSINVGKRERPRSAMAAKPSALAARISAMKSS